MSISTENDSFVQRHKPIERKQLKSNSFVNLSSNSSNGNQYNAFPPTLNKRDSSNQTIHENSEKIEYNGLPQDDHAENKSLLKYQPGNRRELVITALKNGDTSTLATMCIQPGGLSFLGDNESNGQYSDEDFLRSEVWMALLRADSFERMGPRHSKYKNRTEEKIRNEFEMDIVRSMHTFSCCKALGNNARESYREKLADLITTTLVKNQSLYYYQGIR